MAGTVSAGTYTAGSLTEINRWLRVWQKAKQQGVALKAVAKTSRYQIGDTVAFDKSEIPEHSVKIKAMTGASGGGVSAALYLAGLTTGKAEQLLKEVWTSLDVREMLQTDDLTEGILPRVDEFDRGWPSGCICFSKNVGMI